MSTLSRRNTIPIIVALFLFSAVAFAVYSSYRLHTIALFKPRALMKNCTDTMNIWRWNSKDSPLLKGTSLSTGMDETLRDNICRFLIKDFLAFWGGWNTACTDSNLSLKNRKYACRKGHRDNAPPIFSNQYKQFGLNTNLHPDDIVSQEMCWEARLAICRVQHDVFAKFKEVPVRSTKNVLNDAEANKISDEFDSVEV